MKSTNLFVIATITALSFYGCGKKDAAATSSTSTASASATAAAIVAASAQIQQANIANYPAATAFTDDDEYLSSEEGLFAQSNLVSSDWTTVNANINNLDCGSGTACGGAGQPATNSSLKKWLDNMLDPKFVNTNSASVGLMGRLQNAMTMPCIIGQALGGTSLPSAGTYNLSITTADMTVANTVCKSNLTLQSSPMNVTVTVTDVSATNAGMFDRKVHIVLTGVFDQYMLIKDNASVTRVLTSEANTNQGYPYMNRYFIKYDKGTKVGLFEGLERGYPANTQQGGFYFYRVYVNETSQDIHAMGQNGGVNGDGSATGVLTARTLFGGSGNFAQSNATMAFLVKDAAGTAQVEKIGCINMSNIGGDVASAGACPSLPMTTLTSGGTTDALVNTTVFGKTQAQWNVSETIADLAFDGSTIFTAAPAN